MGRLQPIIGVEIINDIRVGQSWHEVDVIERLIKQRKPVNFIEIGVHEGGLSYILIPKMLCYYLGVEIDCNLIRPEVYEVYKQYVMTAQLMCIDCFDSRVYNNLDLMDNKIIYCDGGHKAKEIAHFKSACHPGDIIMCHDFYDGTRTVRGVPIENISIEVTTSDIQIYESDVAFERLPEDMFKETRIIGWRKL
jgi:hypothetical protein